MVLSRFFVSYFLLHLSDISGAAKPELMFQKWADLVFEEFFAQGDIEKSLGMDISPLCDRHSVDLPKSQIDYINYVILPSFIVLQSLIPTVHNVILQIKKNLSYWKEKQLVSQSRD